MEMQIAVKKSIMLKAESSFFSYTYLYKFENDYQQAYVYSKLLMIFTLPICNILLII